jgi:hypothetical protein
LRASVALLSFAALTASALGCGATVEVPRICFSEAGLAVPGSPAGGTVTSPRFTVDVGSQIPLLRTNTSGADLRVTSVTITPAGSSPDLSGIQTATVQAQPTAGPAVDVVSYQRVATAPAPTALALDGDTVNLIPYLVSGRAILDFTLSGQPPRASWTADVKTCLRGEASVSP